MSLWARVTRRLLCRLLRSPALLLRVNPRVCLLQAVPPLHPRLWRPDLTMFPTILAIGVRLVAARQRMLGSLPILSLAVPIACGEMFIVRRQMSLIQVCTLSISLRRLREGQFILWKTF